MIAIIILVVIIILILASCIKIVPQANAYVVERLGKYNRIDPHGNIIFCNHWLRGKVNYLFF